MRFLPIKKINFISTILLVHVCDILRHFVTSTLLSWRTYTVFPVFPSCFDPAVYNGPLLTSFFKVAFVEWKVARFYKRALLQRKIWKNGFEKKKKISSDFFLSEIASFQNLVTLACLIILLLIFFAYVITWKFASRISRVLNIAVIYRLTN